LIRPLPHKGIVPIPEIFNIPLFLRKTKVYDPSVLYRLGILTINTGKTSFKKCETIQSFKE
jgi:hypothetical protein